MAGKRITMPAPYILSATPFQYHIIRLPEKGPEGTYHMPLRSLDLHDSYTTNRHQKERENGEKTKREQREKGKRTERKETQKIEKTERNHIYLTSTKPLRHPGSAFKIAAIHGAGTPRTHTVPFAFTSRKRPRALQAAVEDSGRARAQPSRQHPR